VQSLKGHYQLSSYQGCTDVISLLIYPGERNLVLNTCLEPSLHVVAGVGLDCGHLLVQTDHLLKVRCRPVDSAALKFFP